MRLMKYTEGWTRRHFLEQAGKGIFAAGVLNPLMDIVGRNGSLEAAYPPELLSIEITAGDAARRQDRDARSFAHESVRKLRVSSPPADVGQALV